MTTAELIKSGNLAEARKNLVEEVKAAPADLGKRTTFIQVLCFCGEWDKAERQLDAISVQDPQREISVQTYKNLIRAEKERQNVLAMKSKPAFLPKTPGYFGAHWDVLACLLKGDAEKAENLFQEIESQRPGLSGTVNGIPFKGISDTDSFLSFFLETIVHDRYIWIPFESIRELTVTPPKTLFDLLWVPGRITTWDGLTLNCFLPVVYGESWAHADDTIRMGRITTWTQMGGPFLKAVGQHLYDIGGNDMAILEIQEMVFNPPTDRTEGRMSDI
ncbi:MAG: type VI secretion system accessory protein TagJ [Desulfobacterales bacterium]|jgi:type VI secretion system protein ImpE|nr:type VI secretion system accessory protein TagJ [Desulfobacterales bacterium]